MADDADWAADLDRYGMRRPFLKEQSIWAIAVYRFGRRIERRSPGLLRRLAEKRYWLLYRIVETLTGPEPLPLEAWRSLPKISRIVAAVKALSSAGRTSRMASRTNPRKAS